jgi:5'(3')-deoxyribonucleotidase
MAGKEIIYIDMDGVIVDFPSTIEEVSTSIRESCVIWCQETGKHYSDYEGIFKTLKPMQGAVSAVTRLMEKYEVYILSTAPWKNISSLSEKRQWIEEYLPNLPRKHLILSHRKDLNRGKYLIDDRDKNGAKEFGEYEGQEWIHFGSEKFPDWDALLAYLV